MKTSCCHSHKKFQDKGFIICMNPKCGNYLSRTEELTASNGWSGLFAASFFFFFFVLSFNDYSSSSTEVDIRTQSKVVTELPLSKDNLREELNKLHVICPEQVYAQIMIESAHLNSFLVKRVNNLLGMRYPFKRETTAIGLYLPDSNIVVKGTQAELKKYAKRNHYAVYANWQDCVKDYKLWQENSFKLTERYLSFLGKYYAEDTLYVAKIKRMTK